jgi:hypothetical protein
MGGLGNALRQAVDVADRLRHGGDGADHISVAVCTAAIWRVMSCVACAVWPASA